MDGGVMKTSEVLKAAKAKLEQGFTQGEYARDALGCGTTAASSEAVCWCSLGAIDAVADMLSPEGDRAVDALSGRMDGWIPSFNDTHTKEEVLAKFDEAIALAEAEESA
jgi:hypothetical protein